jgi:hypothetical protein
MIVRRAALMPVVVCSLTAGCGGSEISPTDTPTAESKTATSTAGDQLMPRSSASARSADKKCRSDADCKEDERCEIVPACPADAHCEGGPQLCVPRWP